MERRLFGGNAPFFAKKGAERRPGGGFPRPPPIFPDKDQDTGGPGGMAWRYPHPGGPGCVGPRVTPTPQFRVAAAPVLGMVSRTGKDKPPIRTDGGQCIFEKLFICDRACWSRTGARWSGACPAWSRWSCPPGTGSRWNVPRSPATWRAGPGPWRPPGRRRPR